MANVESRRSEDARPATEARSPSLGRCCRHHEDRPATFARALHPSHPVAVGSGDEHLIVPHSVSTPSHVAGVARGHQVPFGAVLSISVQVIDHQSTLTCGRLGSPRHHGPAVVAGVGSRAETVVQQHPVLVDHAARRRYGVIGTTHQPVPRRLVSNPSTLVGARRRAEGALGVLHVAPVPLEDLTTSVARPCLHGCDLSKSEG